MRDRSTEGWMRARTGSWVTGAAKRESIIAEAGGLDAIMEKVARNAINGTYDEILGSKRLRAKKPRLHLVS